MHDKPEQLDAISIVPRNLLQFSSQFGRYTTRLFAHASKCSPTTSRWLGTLEHVVLMTQSHVHFWRFGSGVRISCTTLYIGNTLGIRQSINVRRSSRSDATDYQISKPSLVLRTLSRAAPSSNPHKASPNTPTVGGRVWSAGRSWISRGMRQAFGGGEGRRGGGSVVGVRCQLIHIWRGHGCFASGVKEELPLHRE